MKYVLLRTDKPTDPRTFTNLGSVAELDNLLRPVISTAAEADLVPVVRKMYPDAVPMVFPVKLGATETFLLGFVEDPSIQVAKDADIPFVLFVHARSEGGGDTFRLKKDRHNVYDRALWRLPPIRPELAALYDVECRITDLEVPLFTTVRVGSHNGKTVLWADLLGKEISFTFEDDVVIADRPTSLQEVRPSQLPNQLRVCYEGVLTREQCQERLGPLVTILELCPATCASGPATEVIFDVRSAE